MWTGQTVGRVSVSENVLLLICTSVQLKHLHVQDSKPQTVHILPCQMHTHSSYIHSNSYLLVSFEGSMVLGNCTGLDEVEQLLNLRLHKVPLAYIWDGPWFLLYYHNNSLCVPLSDGNKGGLVKERIRPAYLR